MALSSGGASGGERDASTAFLRVRQELPPDTAGQLWQALACAEAVRIRL